MSADLKTSSRTFRIGYTSHRDIEAFPLMASVVKQLPALLSDKLIAYEPIRDGVKYDAVIYFSYMPLPYIRCDDSVAREAWARAQSASEKVAFIAIQYAADVMCPVNNVAGSWFTPELIGQLLTRDGAGTISVGDEADLHGRNATTVARLRELFEKQ